MIGICTDSGSQLPAELIDRHGIEVTPLTVTVDGVAHLEHVELDADAFYTRFDGGKTPEVATAAPSPGQFLAAYEALAARGADEILSIHVGADLSGTLNAAGLAARMSPVPVRLVDTASASFVVGAATWAAAEAVAGGASLDDAAAIAGRVARTAGNIFVVGALDLARAGGRLAPDAPPIDAIPVLALADGKLTVLGQARSVDDAVEVMATAVLAGGSPLRVGVGTSDARSQPIAGALTARLAPSSSVVEIVQYRVGPSVGAHTGPGTAGAVFFTQE
jgi:DegV family protein with EDD domain